MAEHQHTVGTADKTSFDAFAPRMLQIGVAVGILALAMVVWLCMGSADEGARALHAYVWALCYFVSISVGALFFVILQYLTRAGWSVVVRRIAEMLACNLPLLVVLFIPIIILMWQGNHRLYEWVNPELVAKEPLLQAKQAYLNVTFFTVRYLIYFAVWGGLARYYLSHSLKQDETGDPSITAHLQRFSAPAMFLFAMSTTFFAFDTLMSLEPKWFSTIFGVYFFAGSVLSSLATTILISQLLQRAGLLKTSITVEHYHDLGKLLFGFVFFWSYIAFSQYVLIWYGNIPEETEWFMERQTGDWVWVSLSLLFGHFMIPFVGLMSRHAKRCTNILAFWAVYLLIMHLVDLYWLVMPSMKQEVLNLGMTEICCWVGVGGLYVANFAYTARNKSLLAVKDPRLAESLAFENV